MTTVEKVTGNAVAALREVLTAEQLEKLTVTKAGRRYAVRFDLSAQDAYTMVNDAMAALADAGRKSGFPHQSLHQVRMRLRWAQSDEHASGAR